MTTKAQDAVIDAIANDATVRVCVLGEGGRRISPWSLIAEDGATMTLHEEPNEAFDALDRVIMGVSDWETT